LPDGVNENSRRKPAVFLCRLESWSAGLSGAVETTDDKVLSFCFCFCFCFCYCFGFGFGFGFCFGFAFYSPFSRLREKVPEGRMRGILTLLS